MDLVSRVIIAIGFALVACSSEAEIPKPLGGTFDQGGAGGPNQFGGDGGVSGNNVAGGSQGGAYGEGGASGNNVAGSSQGGAYGNDRPLCSSCNPTYCFEGKKICPVFCDRLAQNKDEIVSCPTGFQRSDICGYSVSKGDSLRPGIVQELVASGKCVLTKNDSQYNGMTCCTL